MAASCRRDQLWLNLTLRIRSGETVNSSHCPYRTLGKHFKGGSEREGERERDRHFPFRGPRRTRSILSRKISGFESVPGAILRMIRLFVRSSRI